MIGKEKIYNLIKKNILLKFEKNENYYRNINNDWNWIFDFRKGFLNAHILEKFSSFFWDNYEKYYPFQIGWIESWAIPFVSWILLEWKKRWYNINAFYIRKKRKEKWLWNFIEWNIGKEKIFIVDDLFNSGQSMLSIVKALNGFWQNIFKIFVFINFSNPNWKFVIKKFNLDIDYLFTLSDFDIPDITTWGFKDYPIIYPSLKKIFYTLNQNFFLNVPKSNPLFLENVLVFWGEWWNLFCINKDTWDLIWEKDIPKTKWHKNILSSPIIINNEVVFGSYDGNIYFIDLLSWKQKKCIETRADFIWSSPCYDEKNEILFIGLEHASVVNVWSLLAFDCRNEKTLWEFDFDDFVHCSPACLPEKQIVICWWNDGKVVWLNSKSGGVLFELNFSSPLKWGFSFSECWKYAFFGTHDYCFYKLDIDSWKIIFKVKTENIIYTKPLIVWEEVFFGGLDKKFYHIDWKNKKYNYNIDSNPLIVNKIRTWGKIFWEPILIENQYIVFSSNDGFIYFYNLLLKKVEYIIFHGEKINNKMIYEEKYNFLYVYDYVWGVYKYNLKKYLWK